MATPLSEIQEHFQSIRYNDDQLLDRNYMKLLINENLLQVLVKRAPSAIHKELEKRHGYSGLSMTALYQRTNDAYDFVACKVGVSKKAIKHAMKVARARSTSNVDAKHTPTSPATHSTMPSIGLKSPDATDTDHTDCESKGTVKAEDALEVSSGDISNNKNDLPGPNDHKQKAAAGSTTSEFQEPAAPILVKKIKIIEKKSGVEIRNPPIILKISKRKRAISAPIDHPPVKLPKLYNNKARAKSDPVFSALPQTSQRTDSSPSIKLRLSNSKKRAFSDNSDDDDGRRPKIPKLKLKNSKRNVQDHFYPGKPAFVAADSVEASATQAENATANAATAKSDITPIAKASNEKQTTSHNNSKSQLDCTTTTSPPITVSSEGVSYVAHYTPPNAVTDRLAATDQLGGPSFKDSPHGSPQDSPSGIGGEQARAADSGHHGEGSSPLSSLTSSPENPAEKDCASTTQAITGTLEVLDCEHAFLLQLTDREWKENARISDLDMLLRAAVKYSVAGIVRKVNSFKPKNPLTHRQMHDRVWYAKSIISTNRGVSFDEVEREYKTAVALQLKLSKLGKPSKPNEERSNETPHEAKVQAEMDTYYSPAGPLFFKGGIKAEYQ